MVLCFLKILIPVFWYLIKKKEQKTVVPQHFLTHIASIQIMSKVAY